MTTAITKNDQVIYDDASVYYFDDVCADVQVAALTKLADSYAEVENVQVKVSNDRLSAMVLMRHLNGQHTLLMAARNVSGEVIGVRATLIKAGGDLSGFQKPSDIKPA